MRIAVMGTGGVGGCLGALLARAGNDVSLIARGEHLKAIQASGLRLKQDDAEFTVNVPATGNPAEIGPVDLVLYTVKTYHNAQAIPSIRPLLGPGTAVLTLQNGVECHLQLAAELGPGHAMPGAYWTASSIESPGVIASVGPAPRLSFGEEAGGTSRRAEAVRDALAAAGIEVELSPEPMQVIWSKFIVLCSVAGITSAARTRIRAFLQYPEGLELFTAAMREADEVGRAKGINLPEGLVESSVDFIRGFPDFQNSMHADFENGRPTELDALNGAVVRAGKETGIPTPVNEFIYAVLAPLKDGTPV
ncbi:MAG: 2-dehydropantoate 2-reductase [Chloroflexi bacterium]|nr:2-dehydropantoate 2-reductase [Chloroflexota bacterium]MYE39755.1 2-dehydropantoate 2-reductase [Chloroflexota bacterium]